MSGLFVQAAAAFFAIIGFSLIQDVPRKFLLFSGAAAGAGWLAYLLAVQGGLPVSGAAFLSSLAASVLSHLFARLRKAPVTVFLVGGILPAVPGASIYRCVYYTTQGNAELSSFYLMQTVQIAGAMALAIFIVDSGFRLLQEKRG